MLSRKKLASVPAQACSIVQFSQVNSELLWNMKKKIYGWKSVAIPCNVMSLKMMFSVAITRLLWNPRSNTTLLLAVNVVGTVSLTNWSSARHSAGSFKHASGTYSSKPGY